MTVPCLLELYGGEDPPRQRAMAPGLRQGRFGGIVLAPIGLAIHSDEWWVVRLNPLAREER